MFNAEKVKNECVLWIRDFFEKNGKDCNAVIGISGGLDSTLALLVTVKAFDMAGIDRKNIQAVTMHICLQEQAGMRVLTLTRLYVP